MILYHASYIAIEKPDLLHSRDKLDFGRGFYVTTLYEQAEEWGKRVKAQKGKGIISLYEMDDAKVREQNVLEFDSYSEKWLDFILTCRSGKDETKYDVVIGGIANDKVFNTVELFFDGLIDKKEAIKRLRYEKPNKQICFRTERALNALQYMECKEI